MKYYTISLFPEIIDSYVKESILGRAIQNKIVSVKNYHLREYTKDKHKRTDGKPFGGGPGMVIWVDPIINAFEKILKEIEKNIKINKKNILIINFVPSADIFTNIKAKEYSKKYSHIIFICGRYEGIDARVNTVLKDILNNKKKELREKNISLNFKIENISIGNFVITGGELAANIMIDSISRQIEGVLNKSESIEENRIASSEIYGRPEIYERKIGDKKAGKIKKYTVPKVLLSGNHKEIENWRNENNLKDKK